MKQPCHPELLAEATAFQAKHKLTDWKLSMLIGSGYDLIRRWRDGSQLRAPTLGRVRRLIDGYDAVLLKQDVVLIAAVMRTGGIVRCRSDGVAYDTPTGVGSLEFRRMVDRGYLVPDKDSMFGAVAQTYRLAPKDVLDAKLEELETKIPGTDPGDA